VVNSEAIDASDDVREIVLAEVRDRALHAADVPVCIAAVGPTDLAIVWVNDAFTHRTGYTLDDVRGRAPDALAGSGAGVGSTVGGPDSAASGVASGADVSSDGLAPRSAAVRVVTADGSSLWTRVSAAPVLDAASQVTHWVYVLLDASTGFSASMDGHGRHTSVATGDDAQVVRPYPGLEVLARVSEVLEDFDATHALDAAARLLSPDIVSWARLYLDDRGTHPLDVTRDGPVRVPRRTGALTVLGAALTSPAGDIVHRLLDGTIDGPVDLDLLTAHPPTGASGWLAARVRRDLDAVRSVVVLPIPGRGRALGVLVVVPRGGGGALRLDPSQLTVLQLAAHRVGLAVDNAHLYAREHRLAEALQRAMLPGQAEVDGLDIWTHYAPNTRHAQIGGDWYDVLQIGPGVVDLVIGDVVGHDVEATAAMGQLRSVVRSSALERTEPGQVLERVDELVAGMHIPRAAGLVLTTLQHRDQVWRAAYSRAGHLPGLLVRAGVATPLDDAGGPLIGFGGRPRETAHVDLEPGDVLVLYTDGLVERRARPLQEGVALLGAVAAGIMSIDAAGIGEELLARLADRPEDDVAIVVVRIPDPTDDPGSSSSPRVRRWRLPSEPASVSRARHAVVRTCRTWNLGVGMTAELVVSELVANAVLHGWGHVSLRLVDTDDGLRIEVADANPEPPVPTDGHSTRVGGFGMQIVDRLAEWGWEPTSGGKVVWAIVRGGTELVT